MHLWCHLLLQAEMTLNMLWASHLVPTILAHAHLHGQHDYNTQPLTPLVMECDMHVVSSVRESWAPHSKSGFNVAIAAKHYRCHMVWLKNTQSVCVGETVFFKYKYLMMPTITPTAAITKAVKDLTSAIKGNMPKLNLTNHAVKELMKIFAQTEPGQEHPQ